MTTTLPFSQACENNKNHILERLRQHFSDVDCVVEIGSGTGQHAAHFSQYLPHLIWQPTDRAQYLPAIREWVEHSNRENLHKPLELDVTKPWPIQHASALFTANTLHIMSWAEVEFFFAGVDEVLLSGGVLCLYGPFTYDGAYTSASNAEFDRWLRSQDPLSGIRDFEAIERLATAIGLDLCADHSMPANNRLLAWTRK